MEQRARKPTRTGSIRRLIVAPVGFWGGLLRVAVLALVSGCSTYSTNPISRSPSYSSAPLSAGSSRVVTASWYGNEFKGHRTSSGEIFDPNGLTAASRSLPLGSHVAVTNVSNGRTVVVRINDRGPYVKGRSIDLSRAAAKQIGLDRKGVGRVEISPGESPGAGVSRVSYTPGAPSPRTARWWSSGWESSAIAPVHHRRYRRRRTRRRIVRNPIEHWIMSALPRL